MSDQQNRSSEFENASSSTRTGLASEFIDFLANNKKWWMLPIILVLLGLAVLVIVGATGGAPFIYTLF